MPRPQGKAIAREERLTRIAALLAENPKLSQRELAALVGVGKSQIDRDIDALQSEWGRERLEFRDRLIEGHHWELVKLFNAIRKKALDPNREAQHLDISAAVKILESDRKLLGLDGPIKIQDVTELPDDELAGRAKRILERLNAGGSSDSSGVHSQE